MEPEEVPTQAKSDKRQKEPIGCHADKGMLKGLEEIVLRKNPRSTEGHRSCLREIESVLYGLVLGVRGTIPSVTEDVVRILSLDTNEFKNKLVQCTLRMSTMIMRAFAGLSRHDQVPDLPEDSGDF
ncbi:hypothetical protein CHS0354_008384 [Potamilus streckersoni]|uniref:Uncharacterized protein n=1 Tax=Potamilus streckersoni TaxID=2493646 RepID=A0AAE0VHP7_9BIVA|nr:hypothetical protein CHS0354_008384 [Potamilus streckersoni]